MSTTSDISSITLNVRKMHIRHVMSHFMIKILPTLRFRRPYLPRA